MIEESQGGREETMRKNLRLDYDCPNLPRDAESRGHGRGGQPSQMVQQLFDDDEVASRLEFEHRKPA